MSTAPIVRTMLVAVLFLSVSARAHAQFSGPSFYPGYTRVPFGASFQVTPVVSGNGMWVRVGTSGSFTFPTFGPLVATPISTPNVLQGPGGRVTLVPSGGVSQRYFVTPLIGVGAVNFGTTVNAPSGGGAGIWWGQ